MLDLSFIFIWDSHHLLSDGWSIPLIIKEIYTFYEMEYKNIQTIKKLIILNSFETIKKDYLLTTSSTDYKSYIVWLLERDFIETKLFWNQELKGFIKPIQLPKKIKYDQQQKEIIAIKQYENKEKEIVFSNKILLTIKEILKNNHLTSNTLIQGIWGLILSIYNIDDDNISDILFGATVSGRSSPSIDIIKIESIIGLFINALPVRIIIDHNKTLIEWLQNIQLHQIEARQYEYTPLVKIQSWSEIKPKGTPIFETLLVFENYPTITISKTNSQKKDNINSNDDNDNGDNIDLFYSFDTKVIEKTNYPITLIGTPNLYFKITYYTNLFEDILIKHILETFESILNIITNNFNKNKMILSEIIHLILNQKEEKQQLLIEWNDTEYKWFYNSNNNNNNNI